MKRHAVKTKYKVLASCCLMFASLAQAEIKFNGFGSVRGTYVDTDSIQRPFADLPEKGELSFKDESVFGLQAKADLGDGLSATIQFTADGKDDFDVEARWAYVSYKFDNHYQVSVGKFANPIFYQSEYEIVGYAHNFGRLPKSVYFGFDFNTVEGIALDTNHRFNGFNLSTKLLYGNWDGDITVVSTGVDETIGIDDLMLARVELSKDWWKVFAGGFVGEFTDGSLNTFLRSTVVPGSQVALENGATQLQVQQLSDLVQYQGKDGEYGYIGYDVDYNNFLSSFEYAKYDVDGTLLPETRAWYLSLGYRFSDYVLLLRKEQFQRVTNYSQTDSIQHPILNAVARGVHDVLARNTIDGIGVSLRYDFHPSAALKFDYFEGEDKTHVDGKYSIASFGLDFVF